MKIISIRESKSYKDIAVKYFPSKWPSVPSIIYEDSINHCIDSPSPLPQWYLLEKDGEIIGCAGLVTNDFVSRMDLWPWFCALYIEEKHRGNAYGTLLLEKAKEDCQKLGFESLYLVTDHIGYYEKYGFTYIGQGYHPWDEESRIYQLNIKDEHKKMDFIVKQESKADYDEIYKLIQIAFETAKVKDGDEQDYAVKLRNSIGYIPELALVAEKDDKLIGHIMFTKLYIKQSDGKELEGLLVAPLSVQLEYRDKRVGSMLMTEGLKRAKEMGYKFAILAGDPAYYNRFGFEQSSLLGITNENGIPDQYVLVNRITADALHEISGTFNFF